MTHLEALVHEFLDWQGYLVRANKKVGRLGHGGWEMELDLIGYHPKTRDILHYEPSIDALGWPKREARYRKKIEAARRYIFTEIFPWLAENPPMIRHIAVFISHPRNRHQLAGFEIISIDEMMAKIRERVMECGKMSKNAIPEQYPLLRTLQLSHNGYFRVISDATPTKASAASAGA
ncbi:MAG TPA: hypothetical protein VNF74_08305 [Terriglobales bacterium]|nr:hypothetical protein [Terriglobales bacterium]